MNNTDIEKSALSFPLKKKKSAFRFWLSMSLNLVILVALFVVLAVYGPVLYYEFKYLYDTSFNQDVIKSRAIAKDLPARLSKDSEIKLQTIIQIPKPKSTDFSVIIPVLNINQRVEPNVDLSNDKQVEEALKKGIAWAKGTVEPGDYGNSLLFAHSTRNIWEINRLNADFTLLGKLKINDFFTIVYKNRQMDFIIFEIKEVPANDTSYLTSVAEGRVVTLQTCYPPGSDVNRLLIRGRLVAMETK